MKQLNFHKGRLGEDKAKDYLINRGFKFIESNYKNKIGEIDLVMSDKDFLVFVEVKYKSDDSLGLPEEMISRAKVNQVRRVAEWYIIEHKDICQRFSKFRLDAVCILSGKINYYSDIQS